MMQWQASRFSPVYLTYSQTKLIKPLSSPHIAGAPSVVSPTSCNSVLLMHCSPCEQSSGKADVKKRLNFCPGTQHHRPFQYSFCEQLAYSCYLLWNYKACTYSSLALTAHASKCVFLLLKLVFQLLFTLYTLIGYSLIKLLSSVEWNAKALPVSHFCIIM